MIQASLARSSCVATASKGAPHWAPFFVVLADRVRLRSGGRRRGRQRQWHHSGDFIGRRLRRGAHAIAPPALGVIESLIGAIDQRVEVRFPDPLANPYLGFAALLLAGLDGVKNKLHTGDAMDKDLYDLPPAELKQIPTVCGSLREALENLDKDRDYLKAGGVFDDDFIDSYIELKMTEVIRFEHTPHPVEYEMYYSA